ncbi:MAG: ATP-dependent helicase [Anaerolineae bacterium]
MDFLAGLNSAQVTAVQATDGPVLVLAGPGSGKTRVLTHRIAYLVRECAVFPYHILGVTFTNKAAREMVNRLTVLLGDEATQLTIGTFHAICARILRREAMHLQLDRNFVIYDADDQSRLITRVIKDLKLDPQQYRPNAVLGAISQAKNELNTPKTYYPPTYWHEAVLRAYERYEALKAECNALDFDDLLMRSEELMREHEDVRLRYQKRYTYLLVDEFQDTNKAQYDLVMRLAGERRNVFVVGDEDQSIYSWRGADFRNVRRFRDDYPDAKVVLLEQNYRSTRRILDAAQAVINHNAQRTAKNLWTQNTGGQAIQVFEAYDESEEAEFVVNEIRRLLARGESSLAQCAVMFRTNAQSRPLEDAMVRHGVPYRLIGGTRFYQRREIKDVLSYLHLVLNPNDEVSLARVINVPPRQIGAKTLDDFTRWSSELGITLGGALLRLGNLENQTAELARTPFRGRAAIHLVRFAEMVSKWVTARESLNLIELIHLVLDDTAYMDYLRDGTEEGNERISNVNEIFTVALRYDTIEPATALSTFLEEVALVADTDELDKVGEAVTLQTLHTAKGLEFDTVFIAGMEEGLCPHSRSLDDPNAMEEERRLCYVGITRARKRLYLLRTFRRTLYGASAVRDPSRFLLDIPQNLIEGNSSRPNAVSTAASTRPTLNQQQRSALYATRRTQVESFRPSLSANNTGVSKPNRQPHLSGKPVNDEIPAPIKAHVTSFQTGVQVNHHVFGLGTVISSRIVGDDEEVTVAFQVAGLKRLMASFAKLERR